MVTSINNIVVAHFNESLDWLDDVKGWDVSIYSKGESHPQEAYILPNVGRESNTYFTYIVDNYAELPEWVFFTQGNPFDHVKNMVDILNSFPESKANAKIFIDGELYFFSDGHFNIPLICLSDGKPNDSGLDLDGLWSELFKEEKPSVYEFTAGCMFCVSKDTILARDLDFYKKCLYISETREKAPWEFERIMPYIFDSSIK